MGVREDVLALAEQLASAAGRPGATVDDVLRAAAQLSTSSQLLHLISMFEAAERHFGGGEQSPTTATPEQLDEIFQRAGALAVALDEPLAAAHVAAIAPRVGDQQQRGVLRMFGQMLMGIVTGPDEEQQRQLQAEIEEQSGQAGTSPDVVRKSFTMRLGEPDEGTSATDTRPRCPSCHVPLEEPLPVADLTTRAGPVAAATCGNCGTIIAVLPPADA